MIVHELRELLTLRPIKIDCINFKFRTRSTKWPWFNYLIFGEGIKSTQI